MKIVMIEPISISDKLLKQYKLKMKNLGHELVDYDNRPKNEDIIINRAKDADILIITNLPLSKKIIKKCSKLKMISVAFTGVDHIDIEACKEENITVCNASGYANQAVAELVFGLIFSLLRNIPSCDKVTREGRIREGLVGNELAGKIFGIVGTGSIGLTIAEIAKVFGCKLLGYDIEKKEKALSLGVEYVDLNTLMKKSDIISLHVPLNESTRHLINKDKIQLMNKNSILINAARGEVIDNQALADALNKGEIAGAGIDVFEMEPPIPEDHPILKAKNAIVTPHVGFASQESFEKRAKIVFDNIKMWPNGNPQNIVVK